jgi:hypothetical protein
MTAVAPDPTAETLADGRYQLGDVLGRGGLAVTRRAFDRRLNRHVAVKSLTLVEHRTRFLREAQALARFDHPGIVRVYEVFEDAGTAHLVMELLEGRSVAAELVARGGPLLADEATALAAGAGKALATVHAAGLLHRDVSPSNVVLVPDGRGGRRPVLIDFGLARDVGEGGEMTRMVTPGFAPPEQYGGDASRVGPTTDVYGLAATLYHACASRLPASAVDRQHGARLESLRRIRPDLPRAFCDGVHDGLELDPGHRPATMAAFVARLGLGGETTVLPAPTAVHHRPPWPEPASLQRPIGAQVDAGSPPAGWQAVVPLVLLAVAAGVAAPLAGTAAVVAVGLPVLATVGDRVRGRRRLAVPWRFVRNVGAALAIGLPSLLLAGGGAAAAWLLDRADEATTADDIVAAVAGAGAAVLAVHRVVAERHRLAVPDAVEAWGRRCRDGVLYAAWTIGLLALMGALALRPDLWPLPPP